MNVLALEGYYGGSHRAFLDGWVDRSRHEWTVLTLGASKWKWRMRHGAVSFAQEVTELIRQGRGWDVLFCSDMVNLAEFVGLVGEEVRCLPKVVYFHENQLTYPVRVESERDYQFAMTNMTTALAADAVWFNSAFHRDEFLDALGKFLKRMPDNQPLWAVDQIRGKSDVYPPGIDSFGERGERKAGALWILWAGRWEHDKRPEDFFEAVKILKERGVDFRLGVVGQKFCDVPEVFDWAKDYFAGHIEHWGYQESRQAYRAVLSEADMVVSTAGHEFFGISVVEAIAAGAYPLLPERLSYPEIVSGIEVAQAGEFFYDGSVKGLAAKLKEFAGRAERGMLWQGREGRGVEGVRSYLWENVSGRMDDALEKVISGH